MSQDRGFLYRLFDQLDTLRTTPEVVGFIETNVLKFAFVGLAFGFATLLVEVRLPLKYYWDLPIFAFKRFLENLGVRKRTSVWGYCLDAETSAILPLTAVELLDADSKEVIRTTYSNRLGQYGFSVYPGDFIVRAVKNHYKMPPFYDPENVVLVQVDESYAVPVQVVEGESPDINLPLQRIEKINPLDPKHQAGHFFKTFALGLANGFLALTIMVSLYGWAVTREPLYGVLVAVGTVFLFIKIYILETVGQAAS